MIAKFDMIYDEQVLWYKNRYMYFIKYNIMCIVQASQQHFKRVILLQYGYCVRSDESHFASLLSINIIWTCNDKNQKSISNHRTFYNWSFENPSSNPERVTIQQWTLRFLIGSFHHRLGKCLQLIWAFGDFRMQKTWTASSSKALFGLL